MRVAVAAALLFLFVGCGHAPQGRGSALRDRIDEEARACEPAGELFCVVTRLRDGEDLVRRGAQRLVRPASTMKLLTVATAFHHRIQDRSLITRLRRTEDPSTLLLEGGGDPLLDADELASLLNALPAEPKIERILVDGSCFSGGRFGSGWMWDDEPASFLPHLSGLVVNRGCVDVVVSSENDRARVVLEPASRHLRLKSEVSLVPKAPARLRITRDWQDGGRTVSARGQLVWGTRSTRSLSVPEPDLFAGEVLAEFLRGRGHPVQSVERATPAQRGGSVVAVHERPALELLPHILKDSDNLCAECLLRQIPLWQGAAVGSDRGGIAAVKALIAELLPERDPAGFRLADGSGVSHYNLISVELLARILVAMSRRTDFDPFFDALAVAGQDGTLKRRLRGTPLEGVLHAKTGTISGVSSLAGYVDHPEEGRLAFAMSIQNFAGPARPWRDLQDRIVRILAGESLAGR